MSLQFQDVTRRYGDVVAVNRLSLDIRPGVLALVGPNGAGKSTFMRLATGHVKPTSGTVTAFDAPVWDNPAVLGRIGYVPEQDAYYEQLTGLQFVTDMAMLSGMDEATARRRAIEELDALGLGEARNRPVSGYSKGMRQRVKLAQALVHDPDLVLMDEPMLGCDPVARRIIRDRIRDMAKAGKSIVVSTHILPEAAQMTRRIAIMVGGRVVAQGDANAVRDALTQVPSRIRILCTSPRTAATDLATWDEVESVHVKEGAVEISTPGLRGFLEHLHKSRPKAWGFQGHETLDADLDSLFGYVAGGRA